MRILKLNTLVCSATFRFLVPKKKRDKKKLSRNWVLHSSTARYLRMKQRNAALGDQGLHYCTTSLPWYQFINHMVH